MKTIAHQSGTKLPILGLFGVAAIALGSCLAISIGSNQEQVSGPQPSPLVVAGQIAQVAGPDGNSVFPPATDVPNHFDIDPTKLTSAEQAMLKELPPICISDLPKMHESMPELKSIPDHSQFTGRNLLIRRPESEQQSGWRKPDDGVRQAAMLKSSESSGPEIANVAAQFPSSGLFGDLQPNSNSQSAGQRYDLRPPSLQQKPNPLARGAEQFESRTRQSGSPQSPIGLEGTTDGNVPLSQIGLSSPKSPKSIEWEHRTAALTNPHAELGTSKAVNPNPGTDPHLEIYSRSAFPSAQECAVCHQQIYDEWASSSHAYAAVSPMFHAFEDKINMLSQGTIGYFCMRCHAPVATTMGLRRDQAIWDGPAVFKEGVTCVACHRVKSAYTKANGERRIEAGDIYAPVYGAADGRGVDIVRKYKDHFKVKTNPNQTGPGQPLHRRGIQFEEISKSTFCVSCHQVAVQPGIKLEVVWDQYRGSPAFREGISCQDCHMGRVPGVNEGYSTGPGAVVNGKVVNAERKHSNHIFYGPGYSIAHPGIFPFNKEAERWTFNQWLEYDWRAGWGTDAFEDALADGRFQMSFPPAWQNVDDRYDAREIVDANLKKLTYKKDLRRQVLENGSKLDGPFFTSDLIAGQPLTFKYCVTNLNNGHNMPSGSLGAQPQLWLNVVLIGPNGNRVWETGYLDTNGDLADNHSLDVLARKVPLDEQLMNFQTKFLTTNVKGTDREMYLPINVDIDQLPFLRPAPQPVSVLNHPPFIRMEAHSIPPTGSRTAKFVVPSRLMQQPGKYRLSARLRSRAEPIYFMRFCEATPEMERMMNEWMVDAHLQSVTFEVR